MPAETTWDLRGVPVGALAAELFRRGVDPLSCLPDLRLPGLVVRPSHYLAHWDGRDARVEPRQMDVLLVLVRCHPYGVTPRRLAQEVYGDPTQKNLNSARAIVYHLRKALPGLLNEPEPFGGHHAGVYRLAGVEAVARRSRVRIVGA